MAAVETSRLHCNKRSFGVAGMSTTVVVMESKNKTCDDFVSPTPYSIIRRPSGISAVAPINGNVLHVTSLLQQPIRL